LTEELIDILQGCIKGKRAAQERLYKMYSAKMFSVCLRYSRNYEDAKDTLQDGFIKVFEKINQFKNKGSLEGWIRRVIANTALEKYRRSNPVIVLEQIPEVREEDEDETFHPQVSMNEMLGYIQALPDRYRMVFNLYVFEELTHKEIANNLGITEGTSKSDLSRARTILQNKINSRVRQIAQTG
jgi:RNA polymerase sigma-70 factor (ECF subfamily)